MSELLPCPFCGGEAHTYRNHLWHVACERALQGCVTMSAFVTEAEAIATWNTRTERTCHDIKPPLPYFKCDVCGMADMGGREIWISDGFYRGQKPHYCPNCGAKVEQ